MKYLIRSIKYFIFVTLFFCLAICLFFYTSDKQPGLTIFDLIKDKEHLILFFVGFSLIYPAIGYYKKKIYINDNFDRMKGDITNLLINAKYVLVSDENGIMTFRLKSKFLRVMRMGEDFIFINYSENPIIVSGLRKDVVRFGRGIEYIFQRDADNTNN